MNGEMYTTSPGPNIPPSPFQFAVNRKKDDEIRKLKSEIQSLGLSLADLEAEIRVKENSMLKKDKLIAQLKQAKGYLKSTYEQEIESLKQYQEQCRTQQSEIKRLQQNIDELNYQKEMIDCLENEKETLISEKETLLERISSINDNLIENNYLHNFVEDQKMEIEELRTIIGRKNADIEEYRNLKELYQQLQTQHKETLELSEQQRMNQFDISGEILSVVCVEKQIEELKTELDEVRVSNTNEILTLQRERDETINEMQMQLDKKDQQLIMNLDLLDRLVKSCENNTQDLLAQINRFSSAFSCFGSTFTTIEKTCIQQIGHLELENNVKNEQIKLQLKEIIQWKLDAQTLSRGNDQFKIEKSQLESDWLTKNEELEKKSVFVREMSDRFESVRQKHEKQREDFENDVQHLRDRFHLMERKLTEAAGNQRELEDEIQRLNDKLLEEKETGSSLALDLEENRKLFFDFKNEKTREIKDLKAQIKLLEHRVRDLTGEKIEFENSLEKMVKFVDDLSLTVECDRVETESRLEVITLEMKLAENKLSFLEANVQQFQEREVCYVDTIGQLSGEICNYKSSRSRLDEEVKQLVRDKESLQTESNEAINKFNELQNRFEVQNGEIEEFVREKEILQFEKNDEICKNIALRTRLEEDEKMKQEQIDELIRQKENMQIENDEIVSEIQKEMSELENRLITKENLLREFAERLRLIENETSSAVEEFCAIEVLETQMQLLERCVQNAEDRELELTVNIERLHEIIHEKENYSLKADKELREFRDANTAHVAALIDEKELLNNDKIELEDENRAFKMCIEENEDKMTALILELNKLRSEKSEMGLSHELEMADKLQFFRIMWETDKSALELELDSRVQETENLKEGFVERLKQEEMKCKVLRQNLMSLQEQTELTMANEQKKANAIILELKEKMELYKQHYEDQKEKISKLTQVIFKEKSDNSDGLRSQFNSTDSLENSLNVRPDEFQSKMSAFQSGDHKVEVNKKAPQQFKFYMGADEEDEEWDLKYVKQLKVGSCDVPFNDRRLTELQRRNTLCLPHLKTTYPVETQMCSSVPFEDVEFQKGKAILEEFKVSASNYSSPIRKRGKADADETPKQKRDAFVGHETPKQKVKPVFRKPGSPARAKNMSFSKNLVKTPSSLKRLFGSRRVFKPNLRQPVAFNVGFSPLKQKSSSMRRLEEDQLESPKSSGFMRNKLKIFSSKMQKKRKDENVLNNF